MPSKFEPPSLLERSRSRRVTATYLFCMVSTLETAAATAKDLLSSSSVDNARSSARRAAARPFRSLVERRRRGGMHSCVGEKWGLLDAPQFVMTVGRGRSLDRSEANSEAHCIALWARPASVRSTTMRSSFTGGGLNTLNPNVSSDPSSHCSLRFDPEQLGLGKSAREPNHCRRDALPPSLVLVE